MDLVRTDVARRKLGIEAEQNAASILGALPGWRLLCRNYRFRGGEIDLVFEEVRACAGTFAGERGSALIDLVFVEVRARSAGGWVGAVESVDGRKRARLQRAAACFLSRYEGRAQGVRFDIIAWDGDLGGGKWTHVRDAWFT